MYTSFDTASRRYAIAQVGEGQTGDFTPAVVVEMLRDAFLAGVEFELNRLSAKPAREAL